MPDYFFITKMKKGFTLIEVIISIAIAALLFTMVTSIYSLSQETYNHNDTKAEITQNGRVILDRLIREIRQTPEIVTEIPETNGDPDSLPEEIMFQDGHDTSNISYIRYYLENSDIKRQSIVYSFPEDPDIYVYWHATSQSGQAPEMNILEDKIIGEYVSDIEFWGDKLINVNLYLSKDNQSEIIFTSVYGRNL
ncbi:MAG: prepilin-type N-terminal cleavage/methylation domain-containing protein [Patescibacteria group bacterium]